MLIKNNVIVMNQTTWDKYEERLMDSATRQPDPIAYIHKAISGIEVYIDNDVPTGYTEVWEKEQYLKYKNTREKGD